ncbi:acetyl-CoA synthetase-like protein [Delitschia confertaspora ATCC 74209]|uniref:Acetyl-CoA synthetase-like protein n=1 Tax=Delitschia confertaspora ATCC 74209 TaxID=1513339 RepID=A0A9P4JIF0_9PLEO|nr:acetyl-CoA synthetase-like protein [Delitschia confertaspora ATCC 74209]
MATPPPNYFTCTLGQAAKLNKSHPPKPYKTIPELIKYHARHNPNSPAVGFPIPPPPKPLPHSQPRHPNQTQPQNQEAEPQWTHRTFTFSELSTGINIISDALFATIGPFIERPQTVALLCPSGPVFLFTWLALMDWGCGVLLLAPQVPADGIRSLCEDCSAMVLLFDRKWVDTSSSSTSSDEGYPKPPYHIFRMLCKKVLHHPNSPVLPFPSRYPHINEHTTAYTHHTSGTSTGLPKPIHISHHQAIGVLPHLTESPGSTSQSAGATFTTTPLYHGGIADVLRAWTSDAMVWLFPASEVPITARNIFSCIQTTERAASVEGMPGVKYFSSVPYVLQMLSTAPKQVDMLRSLDIVGVGGAALPVEVGDKLVSKGVNLISRFGSAESGFLLSSHRTFSLDKEWAYLRAPSPSPSSSSFSQNTTPSTSSYIEFEEQPSNSHDHAGGGKGGTKRLYELVVKRGWPYIVKSNRPDGSYATADVFERHPMIQGAWKYHSRADGQVTLVTGEKFDPEPLESALSSSSVLLSDVLVFGNGRPFPGALVFRSEVAKGMDDESLLEEVGPLLENLNRGSQGHARVQRGMLVPMPYVEDGVSKSSKGTVLRGVVERRYRGDIEGAYERMDTDFKEQGHVGDRDVMGYIKGVIEDTVGWKSKVALTVDTDLFAFGVDSVAGTRIRQRLKGLVGGEGRGIPLSIVEDCGSVRGLGEYVLQKRHGIESDKEENEEQLMLDLVNKFSHFKLSKSAASITNRGSQVKRGRAVVLTGATGALGAHILHLLRMSDDVEKIYCLVRGSDDCAARERINKALTQKGLEGLDTEAPFDRKVQVLQAELSDPLLGLGQGMYEQLATHVDLILHIAWTVNFLLPLRTFIHSSITGLHNLLTLALHARNPHCQFSYCSSTASSINSSLSPIPEKILKDPEVASPLGYSRSKWVAEQICLRAHESTELRGRVRVMRVGQLGGDSRDGVWNEREAWVMIMESMGLVGCLPVLRGEGLDWLAVDLAAKAFLEAANVDAVDGAEEGRGGVRVFHILNEHREPQWNDLLHWLRKKEDFDIVSPQEWIRRLENCQNSGHPALKLLGLWKESHCIASENSKAEVRPRFELEKTKRLVPVMRDVKAVDEEYVGRIWGWVRGNLDR